MPINVVETKRSNEDMGSSSEHTGRKRPCIRSASFDVSKHFLNESVLSDLRALLRNTNNVNKDTLKELMARHKVTIHQFHGFLNITHVLGYFEIASH